jgi:hypothetical protein
MVGGASPIPTAVRPSSRPCLSAEGLSVGAERQNYCSAATRLWSFPRCIRPVLAHLSPCRHALTACLLERVDLPVATHVLLPGRTRSTTQPSLVCGPRVSNNPLALPLADVRWLDRPTFRAGYSATGMPSAAPAGRQSRTRMVAAAPTARAQTPLAPQVSQRGERS